MVRISLIEADQAEGRFNLGEICLEVFEGVQKESLEGYERVLKILDEEGKEI